MGELKPCPFCGGEAKVKFEKDGKWRWFYVQCRSCGVKTEHLWSQKAAVNAWNDRYEPSNDPLTLDELRQMEGEPVWVDNCGWKICYGVTDFRGELCMETGLGACIYLSDYGKTWHAYRRKPKKKGGG